MPQPTTGSSRDAHRLRSRYALVVAAVALISLAGQVVLQYALSAAEQDQSAAARVARAGMLAMRVVHSGGSLTIEDGDTRIREELRMSVRRLEAAQEELLGAGASAAPPVSAVLGPAIESLAAVSRAGMGLANLAKAASRAERDALVRELRAQDVVLEEQVFGAVELLEAGARERVRWLRWISAGLVALLAGALVVEGVWVLRPALLRLRADFDELAGAEQAVLEAADQERVRLGQEMHDGLCQHLGGLRLLTRAVRSSTEDEAVRRSLDMLSDLAERSLKMTRSFSHGLYPGEVNSSNLATAIERLGSEAAEVDTFAFSFDAEIDGSPPVEDEAAMHLYRVAQEALSNAARHGRPGHVSIELGCSESRLWLSIQDDGVGMSTTVDTLVGAGLSSMRARARAMGADLTISSMPGHGTRVDVTLDLPPSPR